MSSARTGLQTTHTTPSSGNPVTVSAGGMPDSKIEALRNQIRKLETAGRAGEGKVISTGCTDLDRYLPVGGLVAGTITEWLTATPGCGAEWLSLLAAREACADDGALVVIDPGHQFFPPAAAAWGIALENVVVLKNAECGMRNALLWAIDQALRCPAVAAVWGPLGRVSERWLRRFQLSAEQSGAMGLFVRPASVKGQPGWSEVQIEVGGGNGRSHSLPRIPHSALSSKPAPMQRAYERLLEQKQSSSRLSSPSDLQPPTSSLSSPSPLSSFDRFVCLRLLRVRSGQARTDRPITLQIDFTTGTVQELKTDEPIRSATSGQKKKHSVRVAAQLADPKTGGRRHRA